MPNTIYQQLKEHYRYLYDIESQVRKVQEDTGYGEVSVYLDIRKGKIVSGSFIETSKVRYSSGTDGRI